MTVNYVIDPKATWSDGYPITARDFEYKTGQQQLQASPCWHRPFPRRLPRHQVDLWKQRGKTVKVVFISPYSDWEGSSRISYLPQ